MSDSPKVAYIEWLDINNNAGPWVELPDETRPSICHSFGWLLHDDPEFVTISATYSDHENNGHREAMMTTALPKCCITKMQIIDPATLGLSDG